MIDLFFSYAHEDESLRDQLEIHLASLRREGLVRVWHDRRIPPGSVLDREISEHLEAADVILLLVSPYFLASDYCYEIETSRALQRHEAGEAVVVPIILQLSDWHNAPFGKLRASPKDGKPVSKFANIHDAFLEVTGDIRRAAEQLGRSDSGAPTAAVAAHNLPPTSVQRTSNLRIQRTFSDHEKDQFVDDAFSYIRKFFENSVDELATRSPDVECRFKSSGETQFTAAIYRSGEKVSSCRIWVQGRADFGGAIAYSAGDSGASTGINDSLSVEDDGYRLGLRPLGLSYMGQQSNELLTEHGGAEYLWSILISRLQ